jgi:hypothetical protein
MEKRHDIEISSKLRVFAPGPGQLPPLDPALIQVIIFVKCMRSVVYNLCFYEINK